MKRLWIRPVALMLAAALAAVGLCGCRFKSISGNLRELYTGYVDSAEAPGKAPDYENFRAVYPLAVWDSWKENRFSGSERDMKRHFEEKMLEVYYHYFDTCGADNTYTIEGIEHEQIQGEELKSIKEAMQADFGIEPKEVKRVYSAVIKIKIQGSLDYVTITHKQRVMRMNGRWYFCPIESRDMFGVFD